MGKKSKVNKLARMSDEERARYLQHRADLEEEARRRKRELISRFIKNKLDKEEAFNKINAAKINEQWRFILRKIKSKQMASEIESMTTSFNFLLSRKDRLLQTLLRSIDEADDQHRRAFQTHNENLGYVLNIGSQRLNQLQSDYEHQKNSLLDSWVKEESDIVNCQDKAEFKLKLVIYIENRDFDFLKNKIGIRRATDQNDERLEYQPQHMARYNKAINNSAGKHTLLTTTILSRMKRRRRSFHEEDLRAIWRPKRIEVDSYWNQLNDVFNSFKEYHEPIMGHYQSVLEKDEFYQRDIAKNEIQIQKTGENLLLLQYEWQKRSNVKTQKLEKMHNQRENLTKKYLALKKSTCENKSKCMEMLTNMVEVSQNAVKHLEDLKVRLSKIKQLSEICVKYETRNEIEFFKDFELNEDVDYENLDETMIEECKEYQKLNKFFLKVNRSKVQTLCLKAEKAKLIKENAQLKNQIKRYLTDLALKSGNNRPMSMKLESKVQIVENNGKSINRPVTCIEGALSNAVLHERRMKIHEKKNKGNGVKAYPRVQCWM